MIENLEYKGYWYLPNEQENKVAGVLTSFYKASVLFPLITKWYHPGALDNTIQFKLSGDEYRRVWKKLNGE
jgi:hypothetical protein